LGASSQSRVLRADPNRFCSILGVARAAKLMGDGVQSKAAYQQLIVLCDKSDATRPELAEARSFVAN
jgi:hypothetical protein